MAQRKSGWGCVSDLQVPVPGEPSQAIPVLYVNNGVRAGGFKPKALQFRQHALDSCNGLLYGLGAVTVLIKVEVHIVSVAYRQENAGVVILPANLTPYVHN